MADAGAELVRLEGIMARLRAIDGCPWDREQDLRSLRPYLLEEAFEVLEEMDRVSYGGAWRPLCEELGDLLFQIVFHSQLAKERKAFELAEVAKAISDKIVSRHPHVFGEKKVAGSEQVLQNWAKLKAEEKRKKTGKEGSVLDGVPTAAPALMRAERLTEKASRIGFDWPDLKGVREKLAEELGELDQAIASGDRDALEHELGDVLFSLCNLARFIKTPPEDALRQANRRFTERFAHIEHRLREANIPFGTATLAQMETYWQEAKGHEAKVPKPVRAEPKGAVVALTFPLAKRAQMGLFWDRVLGPLGLERRASTGDELRFLAGGLELRFDPQSSFSTHGVEVTFEAPSQARIDELERLLQQLQMPSKKAEGALAFNDPDGNGWRFALRAP